MEIEIIKLVVEGSAKLTVPTNLTGANPSRKQKITLRRVFDIKLGWIHMDKIVLKVWVINGLNVVNVSICEVELRGCFLLAESKDYMNTAS